MRVIWENLSGNRGKLIGVAKNNGYRTKKKKEKKEKQIKKTCFVVDTNKFGNFWSKGWLWEGPFFFPLSSVFQVHLPRLLNTMPWHVREFHSIYGCKALMSP